MEKLIKIISNLSANVLYFTCDKLTNLSSKKIEEIVEDVDFNSIISEDFAQVLIKLCNTPNYIKQLELNILLKHKPEIKSKLKLSYIEDWINQTKFNQIKLLLLLDSFDKNTFHEMVGDSSKKTYISGYAIDDASLAIKKFFNKDFKLYSKQFYVKLDALILQIVNTYEIEYQIVKDFTDHIVMLIKSEIICRERYKQSQLIDYKKKIQDIINTRNEEAELFSLFNKNLYAKLVLDPAHFALKFILNNNWSDTKSKYIWLTHLITYINNSSEESKDYLIELIGFNNFKNKKDLIIQIAKKIKLNMKNKDEIVNFIFDIGTSFKHGTYIKWYNDEINLINTFEQYQTNSLTENIINIINKHLDKIKEPDVKTELVDLMLGHYNIMLSTFC